MQRGSVVEWWHEGVRHLALGALELARRRRGRLLLVARHGEPARALRRRVRPEGDERVVGGEGRGAPLREGRAVLDDGVALERAQRLAEEATLAAAWSAPTTRRC